MTRKELEGVLSEIEPYCYETNRKEYWYKKGCIDGLNATDTEPNLTSLWHDASEEPRYEEFLIAEESDEFNIYKLSGQEDNSWELLVSAMGIIRWAYVKDLLPKENKK